MPLMPLTFLSALLHLYVGWRLVPALPPGWEGWLATAGLVLSAVLMPMGFMARRLESRPAREVLAWVGWVSMGLFSSLFVLTLLRDALLLLAGAVELLVPGWTPAGLVLRTAQAVVVISVLATAWGFANARRRAGVVSLEVPIRGLPPALHGFSIAQISDIHVGTTIRRPYVQAIVDAVNRLQPDMVAVTGDLVDGNVPELSHHVAPLAGLASRHGTFFVTGNHEYYSGVQPWIRELRRLGLQVLLDEHKVLDHGGASLVVAGVTDYTARHFEPAHHGDPQAAVQGAPAGAALRLLLAHQPRHAPAAQQAGFQLQLSGHTHGGQFFPWNLFVPLQQPFTAGLHRLESLWVYTSRGTGYWGPPKRLGAPSEITHLRLVVEPA